ncbi:unnamed protein product [Parnassius mnemosyne]|uniref:Uncharacterized protein n=1 Tax=Parnassius mnemosyne TaxID=213953 RepID=A0AAV1LGB1_9NEOP
MDKTNKFLEYQNDPDFFNIVKTSIDKELSNMKKIVDKINQMRVEAAYLESDLMTIVDAKTWEDITEFIGLAPLKKEN